MTVELAYEVLQPPTAAGAADATPLLIAHGLLGSGRNWATHAKRLSAHRAVATVDMRNHGASPWVSGMAYQDMAGDLLEAAKQIFGRPVLLLGHSMGGKAAMAAALAAPETIAGLLVVDIAPVAYDHPEHAEIVEAMRSADLSNATRRSDVGPQLAEAAPDPALRAFLLANLSFEETADGRRGRWRVALSNINEALDDLTGWPKALTPQRYNGPAFFLHGGASPYVDEVGRRAIAAQFPEAAVTTIPGAGHWPHAEQPEAFHTEIAAWLEGR